MKNHYLLKILSIKKALIIIFSLIIVLSVSILITSEVILKQPDNVQQSIADKFNKIKIQLEFKGITKTVKEITKDYSKLFDGFSNIIITDDSGKILYKVNDGYVSEKNKFSVITNPWQKNGNATCTDVAFVIDSKNAIKYPVQLDIARNMNKLKAESSKNVLSKVLFPKQKDSDDALKDSEITNSDGSEYINSTDTNIIMNYEYVASKGYNLYSLYDSEHQYNNYYIFTNNLKKVRHWLMIVTLLCLIPFWILLPLWVFKDAHKQHLNASKWTIITFFINIFGLGIYIIFRNKNAKYLASDNSAKDGCVLCPYCGEKINMDTTGKHK